METEDDLIGAAHQARTIWSVVQKLDWPNDQTASGPDPAHRAEIQKQIDSNSQLKAPNQALLKAKGVGLRVALVLRA